MLQQNRSCKLQRDRSRFSDPTFLRQELPLPIVAREPIFRVDAAGQEQLNASTGADEPGANKCINWGSELPFPIVAEEPIFRVDAEGQEQLNASTGADEPGANKCINWGSEPMVLVEGGGQEQTNASTEPGANECIN